MSSKTAFPMLEVPRVPPKPRTRSMLLMSETGISLRATEDIIEIAAPIIDYAKITEADPAALDKIAKLGKNEYLLFELGMIEAQEKAAWLVERYGPDINFASVAPSDVVAVDAIRRGMHRKAAFRYMTQAQG